MSTKYPGAQDDGISLPNPSTSNNTNNPSHAGLHDNTNDAIKAIEAKLGTGASTPSANKVLRGTGAGTTAFGQVDLTADVTGVLPAANGGTGGTLPVTNGGTGVTTLTSGNFVQANGAGAFTATRVVPSGAVVGTTDTQTLSNKSMDGSSNTFTNIPASALSTSAITLGYAQITASFSTTSATPTQVTGLSVTITVPTGGRKIKITAFSGIMVGSVAAYLGLSIWDGVVGSGTQLQLAQPYVSVGAAQATGIAQVIITPSPGSKTYNVGFQTSAGTGTLGASATSPAFILVEAI